MRKRLSNIGMMYHEQKYIWISVIFALALGWLMFYFTQFELIAGNISEAHAVAQVVTQTLIALFFGLNISLLVYKLNLSVSVKKQGALTGVGAFLGILLAGCPLCGITVASYLGLASVLSALPFFGMELKVAGLAVLIFSTNSLTRDLSLCRVTKK